MMAIAEFSTGESAQSGEGRVYDAFSAAVTELVDRVNPSIVEVQGRGMGMGAGVIWSRDGQVLTNHHVVVGTAGRPRLALRDGRKFDTEVVASNPSLDLALLKVDAQDLPAATPGDSTRLRVGDLVFAVGHPLGLTGVVTAGVVSGVGEITDEMRGRMARYIRTDVHLAPGNSGGPLLNARGEVVGINAMIFGGDLGVAIPSHVAAGWIAGLSGKRAYLGVGVQPVELPVVGPRGRWRGRAAGLLLVSVESSGPAFKSGLRIGDVLLSAGGTSVSEGDELLSVLAGKPAGETLRLKYWRSGRLHEVDVPLSEKPEQ